MFFRSGIQPMYRPTAMSLMYKPTQPLLIFAKWFAGKHKKHRWAREKRYHPKYSIQNFGRNAQSRKLFYKTNRWNYVQAYKDMP